MMLHFMLAKVVLNRVGIVQTAFLVDDLKFQ